ncbi:substrate-binding domain-containing protein [Pseudomonas sp. UFMG81]|uniref:substrate-binding domain-containing protein n=1 Tax=Pseudomonas sp. UFMG81 TaxID=2745936 RepID=UPI00188F1B21|nr:substrate-binding domain-containing protein [Pseudomonas sp. UFMG81]
MFKRTMIAASMAVAALASAQSMAAVVGGGATLPQGLYTTPGVLGAGFDTYTGVGSGKGKSAFLNNVAADINKSGVTVDFAGSDSVLSVAELSAYNAAHNSAGNDAANKWGPLIQIPSAATSVTVPYKLTGTDGNAVTDLNLTSAQLCSIFSGAATKWSDINSNYPATDIKVFYRSGSSGTSEILSRHLNSICPSQFGVSSTFTTAQVGAEPATFTAVASSSAMATAANSTEGGIGYVGPEDVDATNNAKVARVNGLLPTVGNVVTALSSVTPPANAADRADPTKWAPVLPNPASGYAMVAYTNLIFGQCYQDATDGSSVRDFLTRHYGLTANNDAAITAMKLIPLNNAWKNAVRLQFANQSGALGVNNTSVCNAQGRPL